MVHELSAPKNAFGLTLRLLLFSDLSEGPDDRTFAALTIRYQRRVFRRLSAGSQTTKLCAQGCVDTGLTRRGSGIRQLDGVLKSKPTRFEQSGTKGLALERTRREMMAIKTQPPSKREIKRFQPTLCIAREVRRMEDDGGYASAILVSKGEEDP